MKPKRWQDVSVGQWVRLYDGTSGEVVECFKHKNTSGYLIKTVNNVFVGVPWSRVREVFEAPITEQFANRSSFYNKEKPIWNDLNGGFAQ